MNLDYWLQAVLDDPDADAPRLACAAACAEAGDRDRAEFIRLQMEAASLARKWAGEWWRPAIQADELLKPHREAWAGPIRARVVWYDFYRGFVEYIKLDAEEFLARAGELYRLAPVRRLILTGVKPLAGELFRSPHLARIVQLCLSDQQLDDHDIELLAASPYLGKLAWLDLARNNITLAGIEAMAASSGLGALQYVNLVGNAARSVSEIVGMDGMDGSLFPQGSDDGWEIEQRYGRKTWLHPVEDHDGREVRMAEL